MTLGSRVIERYLRLPPAVTRQVRVERNLPVRARDGVILRANHYAPAVPSAPTVLIRTPYGRTGVIGITSGRALAERGFHVVLQSCRGTFDSGGVFEPMRHEREDGLDTVAWLQEQPWFDGNLFTYGPSYIGFTQWAIAAEAGPVLKGMCAPVTASGFRDPTYAGGAYSLDTILNWATLTANQGGSLLSFAYKQTRAQPRLRRAMLHLPLSEVDALVTGQPVAFFQEWLAHAEPGDPYWADRGHDTRVSEVTAPVCMIGGWYDIFLLWQLRDYAALRAAGRSPRLIIGPWTHADLRLMGFSMREAIRWFRSLADGMPTPDGVRIQIGGTGEWRELPDWPPPTGRTEWYLQPGGALAPVRPESSEPDRFRYDPADPTPSPGGALLTTEAGRRDNRAVEARPDVLVYTSPPLAEDYEVIGPVTAVIYIRSSLKHFDVQVRLCEVDSDGRSWNLTDGLTRMNPAHSRAPGGPVRTEVPVGTGGPVRTEVPVGTGGPVGAASGAPCTDGVHAVEVELWPVGHRLRAGHRIRVHVAGGAHPRHARNPGTGEPLATARNLLAAENEIFHDPDRPSAIRLPGRLTATPPAQLH
jgi:uncharacterized protein